jgi:uncharacterized membrane protein
MSELNGAKRDACRNTTHAMTLGALVIAGLFTFVPGRIMHAVAFGQ